MSPRGTVALVATVVASLFAGLATARDCVDPDPTCALLPAAQSDICSSYFSSNKIKTSSCTSTSTIAATTATKIVSVVATTTATVSTTSTRVIEQTRHRSSTSVTTTTSTTTGVTTTGTDTSTITSTASFTDVSTSTSTSTSVSISTSRIPRLRMRDLAADCECFRTSTIVKTITAKAVTETTTSTISTSTKLSTDKEVTTITNSNVGNTETFTETSVLTSTSSTTTTVPTTTGISVTTMTTTTTTTTLPLTSTISVPADAPQGTSGYLELRPPAYYKNGVPAKNCLSDAAGHLTDNYAFIDQKEFFIITPQQKLYSVTHNSYYQAYDSGAPALIFWVTDVNQATTNFFVDAASTQSDGSFRLRIAGNAPGSSLNICVGTDGGTTGDHVKTYRTGYDPNSYNCKVSELWFAPS